MPHNFLSAVLIAIALLTQKPLAAGTSETAVRIDDSGAVIVPVTIDGKGPFRFLLDTGSTHSVISGELADRLALRFVARTSVLTSTGREWRPVVELNQTSIGTARSEGLLASVAPTAQLDAVARAVDGIIGQDFLFGLNYILDYRRQRLTWNDGNSDDEGTRLPLIAQGGRYLVQVASPGDVSPLLLVPDSGANGIVMFERNGRTRLPLKPALRGAAAHSLSGRQDVRMMVLRELHLGNATLTNQRVAVIERASADAIEGDGLLPLHLFSSVSFNARGGYLLLQGVK